MLDACQHCGHNQVGVSVCPGGTVFQAQVLLVRFRDSDRNDPVVYAPVRLDGREHVRPQAAIRVRVWCADEGGFGHEFEQSADSMTQSCRERRRCHFFFALREPVLAILVDNAHVNVQAAAGILFKRFCHEARDIAVFACRRLDDALEHDRMVTGQHGIIHVVEIDFELSGRVFRNS